MLTKPFLRGCLAEGVVNYSSLARVLMRELEARGVKASHAAVKMALIRIRGEIIENERALRAKLKHVLGSTVLQVQSDLVVVTVKKYRAIVKLLELVKLAESARFFQVLQSMNTFTFIVSKEDGENSLH